MPVGPEPRRRLLRLVVPPLVLFVGVSGLVYGLARGQLLAPSAPAAEATVATGDPVAGRRVFVQACAGCHGANAGGGVGPRLRGSAVTLAVAKSRIDQGKGAMPAGLVSGQGEKDVLGYLATILANGGRPAGAGAGDVYRGGIAFTQTCSGCHGAGGAGGSAPALAGNPLSPEQARAVIVSGRGGMPAGLASGRTLDDIVAYLGTILAPQEGTP